MTDFADVYERKKHLRKMNILLCEKFPEYFPEKAGLSNIWKGVVTINVRCKQDVAGVQEYSRDILETVQVYGVQTARSVDVRVGELFVSSSPTKRLRIDQILNKNSSLSQISKKVSRVERFNSLISERLGSPFPDTAQIGNIKDGVITVVASNTAAATRLRFMEREILKAAIDLGVMGASSVHVKVTPLTVPRGNYVRRSAEMSGESSDALRSTAEYMEDSPLKDALLKLSSRRNKKT